MLLLERVESSSLKLANTMLRRLHKSDECYTYFLDLSNRLQAGFEGEQRVDREWTEITDLGTHFLLFNYEFENEFGSSHQIDTLLITSSFLLIIDIKNITGRVDYDEDKFQFIRTRSDGKQEGFTNPKNQVLRHGQFFDRLFNNYKISFPIEYAVIFSNPSTIIGNVPVDIPFIHANGLRFHISKLQSKYQPTLSEKQLNMLSNDLITNLKRKESRTCIEKGRLKKGVLCQFCNYEIQMIYQNGNWSCPECRVRNKNAFLEALNDYRLLISERIRNREFREFFGIDSFNVASKLLSRSSLIPVGNNKGRYYTIPEDIAGRK
nr:nuclease-related domain-containing protein [Lysinibacillus timonensis]